MVIGLILHQGRFEKKLTWVPHWPSLNLVPGKGPWKIKETGIIFPKLSIECQLVYSIGVLLEIKIKQLRTKFPCHAAYWRCSARSIFLDKLPLSDDVVNITLPNFNSRKLSSPVLWCWIDPGACVPLTKKTYSLKRNLNPRPQDQYASALGNSNMPLQVARNTNQQLLI